MIGILDLNNKVYAPVVLKPSRNGVRLPSSDNIMSLSVGITPPAIRQTFMQNNPIPGSVWDNKKPKFMQGSNVNRDHRCY